MIDIDKKQYDLLNLKTNATLSKNRTHKIFPIVIIWLASHESVTDTFHLLWVLSFEFQQFLEELEDCSCMVFSPNISLEHRSKKCAPWQNADQEKYRDHWQIRTISHQALCWNTCNTLPLSSSVIYPHTIFEDPHLSFQISLGFQPLWCWYFVLHIQAYQIDFGYIVD